MAQGALRFLNASSGVLSKRLILARVSGLCSEVRGLASIWAPAPQDSSHVGNAGVGVISMRGAPVSLLSFATAQFRRFFDCGRAVRCMLSLGASRFTHLVVLLVIKVLMLILSSLL